MTKYQVIYADPPWRYEHPISDSRRIENQYPTMSLEEICSMEVPSDENCVLFMWTTAPKLEESLQVVKAWGFNYRTCLVWDKQIIGMGYWFRNQHELLLVALKGQISPPPSTKRISSIYKSKRQEHSKKPDGIRFLIEQWYPNMKKIELFSRDNNEGWSLFGNEVPKSTQKRLNL